MLAGNRVIKYYFFGSSGGWVGELRKKGHGLTLNGKIPKGKVMSSSVLYHTFGGLGVQYRKTVFLAARQSFMRAFTRII